jgi:hypothetical protein
MRYAPDEILISLYYRTTVTSWKNFVVTTLKKKKIIYVHIWLPKYNFDILLRYAWRALLFVNRTCPVTRYATNWLKWDSTSSNSDNNSDASSEDSREFWVVVAKYWIVECEISPSLLWQSVTPLKCVRLSQPVLTNPKSHQLFLVHVRQNRLVTSLLL